MNVVEGFLLINKNRGITSYDVCHKMKKHFQTKKVGHSGTLDPNANGLMIVAINKATKALQFTPSDKTYTARVELGYQTDTLDIDGKTILEQSVKPFTKERLQAVIEQFKGVIEQTPPIYSAIKVDGKKLYEYAREGKEVEIKSRQVTIFDISIDELGDNYFIFTAHVSSGTYIRTLAFDICQKLDNIGTTSTLTRIKIGKHKLEDACEIENPKLVAIEEVIDLPHYVYENEIDILHGKKVTLSNCEFDEVLLVNKNKKALAVYKKDGNIYRSVRGLF